MEKKRPTKIAVIGAESTGKSWLCEHLAKHFNTIWVPEYAREYFHDSDIYNYTLDDLVKIAKRQIEMETEALKKAKDFLFCDTTLITLKIWAELEFQTVPDFIAEQLSLVKYDHYLITDNSLPWEEDPLRQNKFSRDLIFEMNLKEIEKLQSPYTIVKGSNKDRLKCAIDVFTESSE